MIQSADDLPEFGQENTESYSPTEDNLLVPDAHGTFYKPWFILFVLDAHLEMGGSGLQYFVNVKRARNKILYSNTDLYYCFSHSAEIIMLDGLTCVYRSNVDLFFYVMGSSNENEVIVMYFVLITYPAVTDKQVCII